MSEQMTFADGKYTVIFDAGKLTALRNGEPWDRDLVGDNLVYWMLTDSIALRGLVAALLPYAETQIEADLYAGGVGMTPELDLLSKARAAVGAK
jgi:hypothetical protein